jgi:hypothetical protein
VCEKFEMSKKKNINMKNINKIISLLEKEDAKKLRHDLKLAPSSVSDFVIKHFLNQKI